MVVMKKPNQVHDYSFWLTMLKAIGRSRAEQKPIYGTPYTEQLYAEGYTAMGAFLMLLENGEPEDEI